RWPRDRCKRTPSTRRLRNKPRRAGYRRPRPDRQKGLVRLGGLLAMQHEVARLPTVPMGGPLGHVERVLAVVRLATAPLRYVRGAAIRARAASPTRCPCAAGRRPRRPRPTTASTTAGRRRHRRRRSIRFSREYTTTRRAIPLTRRPSLAY